MPNPQVGFQPRTTPAERRADLDLRRRITQNFADLYDTPEDFTGPITVTVDEPATNYTSNKTDIANVDGAIHFSIRSAGTEIGRITRATSTTAAFLTTSDEDLKENLEPITDDLSMQWMRTIEPLFFNYRSVPDVRHVGYSAQRVANEWPNGVLNGVITPGHGNVNDRTWDEDGNETTPADVWQAWMMDHSKITPILHACMRTMDQVQTDRTVVIAEHEARLDALEATVLAQADQIAVLQQQVATNKIDNYYTRQMSAYWQYSNTLTAPPGAGQIRTNLPLTTLWIHRNDSDGYNRKATLDFIVNETSIKANGIRFRIRGTSGTVYELRTNGRAIDSGTYYTIPVQVLSGSDSDKGFRVEVTMLSGVWADDPPPHVTPLPA